MLTFCRISHVILCIFVLLSSACRIQNADREARLLFSIEYGAIPGQIFPWDSSTNSLNKTVIVSRDRKIYISNRGTLMVFSSKGILLNHVSNETSDRFIRSLAERGIVHTPIYRPKNIILRDVTDSGIVFIEEKTAIQTENNQSQQRTQFFMFNPSEQVVTEFPDTIKDAHFTVVPYFSLSRGLVFIYQSVSDEFTVFTYTQQGKKIQEMHTTVLNFVSATSPNTVNQIEAMVPHPTESELYFQVNTYSSPVSASTTDTSSSIGNFIVKLNQLTGDIVSYMDMSDVSESEFTLEYIKKDNTLVFSDYSEKDGVYKILVVNKKKKVEYVYALIPPYHVPVESYFTFDPAGYVVSLYMSSQRAEVYRWNVL